MYYNPKTEEVFTASQVERMGLICDSVDLSSIPLCPLADNKPPYDPEIETISAPNIVGNKTLGYRYEYVISKKPEHIRIGVMKRRIKDEQRRLLQPYDWRFCSDVNEDKRTPEIMAYRQAVRDVDKQEDYPFNVTWPEPLEVE